VPGAPFAFHVAIKVPATIQCERVGFQARSSFLPTSVASRPAKRSWAVLNRIYSHEFAYDDCELACSIAIERNFRDREASGTVELARTLLNHGLLVSTPEFDFDEFDPEAGRSRGVRLRDRHRGSGQICRRASLRNRPTACACRSWSVVTAPS
jgi:hypothetical protein